MEKLNFTVDSALLSELGERLVGSVDLALLELIKNAYDADATKVSISIIPEMGGDYYEIRIRDNGSGMSFEQVNKYWMRIATNNKAHDSVSKLFLRKKSGSKGIGRFSCRRLGYILELSTTSKLHDGRFETTEISIDWTKYKPGTDVTDITCEGTVLYETNAQTGTDILIKGCSKSEWNNRSWAVLKRRLILLVSDPSFEISLIAPDFEESHIVNPREQLMNAGWGRIFLNIDDEGIATWTLSAMRIGDKTITMPERYTCFAGTSANIAILPQDKSQFRNKSIIALTELRKTLEEWGGVFIRVDGIRVPPYGELGNDWLEIDRDRARRLGKTPFNMIIDVATLLEGVDPHRALLNLLSSHNYVGEVNAVSKNNHLQMKASREGFANEHAVSELKHIIRFGIDWATIYRDYCIRLIEKDSVEEARKALVSQIEKPTSDFRSLSETINFLNTEAKRINLIASDSDKHVIISNISKATDLISSIGKLQQSELQHMRLIASTSSLLLIFQHEVRLLLSNLGLFEVRLNNLKPFLNAEGIKQVEEMGREFGNAKKGFDDLLKMTSLLSVDKNAKPTTKLSLYQWVEKTKACYRLICNNYHINIDTTSIPRTLTVGPMLEAELLSIFLNVLSNAIKSVIAYSHEKNIKITASISENKKVIINILDTGIGISPTNTEVFTPFIADPNGMLYTKLNKMLNPEDKYIIGTGSGLGLSIVREIVISHDGSIAFIAPEIPWNTNLEIVLP